MTEAIKVQGITLPSEIRKDDLDFKGKLVRDTKGYGSLSFGLWYVQSFGWCITTVGIRGASRRAEGALHRMNGERSWRWGI